MPRLLRFNEWSLVYKLITAIVLLTVFVLDIVIIPTSITTSNTIKQQTEATMSKLAEQEAYQIATVLESELGILNTSIAGRDSFRSLVSRRNASYSGSDAEIVAQLEQQDDEWINAPESGNELTNQILNTQDSAILKTHVEETPDHLEVMVLDRYGALVAANDLTENYYHAEEAWWQAAWNDGNGAVYIGTPVFDESVNTTVLEIALPVYGSTTGEVIGVVKAEYDLQALIAQINHFSLGSTGQAQLLDRQGIYITSPHAGDMGHPVEEGFRLDGRTFSGKGYEDDVKGHEGQSYVLGYASISTQGFSPAIDQLNWVVQVFQESSEAFEAVRNQRLIAFFATTFAVLSAIGLAFVISRALTRQAKEISRVFSEVRIGDFAARAQVMSKDELGQVAEGVNAILQQFTDILSETQALAQERISTMALLGWTWELDTQGNYTYCSENVVNVLGYTVDEVLGQHMGKFMPPETAQAVQRALVQGASEKRAMNDVQSWRIHKDGHRVFTVSSGVPIVNDEGEVVGYRGATKDITAQQRADEELKRQQQLLQTILDNIPVGVFAIRAPDGTPVLANPKAIEMLGRGVMPDIDQAELAETYASYVRGTDALYPVDQMPLVRGLMGEQSHIEDMEIQLSDGSRRLLDVQGVPLRNEQGQVIMGMAVFTDITERQQMEDTRAQMLDEMARQKAMLDNNMHDFVSIANMQGQILYLNSAGLDMVGYSGQDRHQLSSRDFYSPEEVKRMRDEILPVVMDKGSWSGETVLQHRDGTLIPVHQVTVLIWDKVGNPQALGSICRNISEQRRVISDIEQATAEMTIATEAMSEIVQLMINQAGSTAKVAAEATSSAQQGDRVVSETITAMHRIRENTQETARHIKRLGEASQEISEVVRLIEELSDRTTILALNASIQAAAAGEAGRGFAVVAEEVQRLAERATGATREIEKLVKSIQAETNQAVVGIEEATREVVGGSQLAQQAGDRMTELNGLVNRLASLMQQSAETTAKQTNESMSMLADLSHNLQVSVAAFAHAEKRSGRNGDEGRSFEHRN